MTPDPDAIPPLVESPAARAMGKVFYDPPQSESTLYRVPALNITFVLSSFLLFLLTVWAIWQDHTRDWKRYNAEWRAIQADQYREKLGLEQKQLTEAKLGQQEKELADLRAKLSADRDFRQKEREARRAENDALMAETEARFFKSKLDSQRFYFEEARKHILDEYRDTPRGREALASVEARFEEDWVQRYEALLREAEEKKTAAEALRKDVEEQARRRNEVEKQIAALVRTRDTLMRSLRQVEPSIPNTIRNAPLIPPYAPTDQIQKVVLSDLTEPLNFLDVPRVDRCKTCHVNIDSPEPNLADFTDSRSVHGGKLFRSHPRLDLFVGSASPHPYEQFGCTICHYGDGHSTSFQFAAHTPRDHAQEVEWEEKYHWHKLHHQDYPMLPMQHISATCAKCHKNQDRVDGAEAYNQGRELAEEYGCFGCHKIEGFEKYRKVGPNLKRIRNKTDLAFLYRWIKDPPGFRPSTKMPRFFDLANTTGTFKVVNMEGRLEDMDFNRRNDVEALALATYIDRQSLPRPESELYRTGAPAGDPARGKEAVRTVGCLGCHSISREGFVHNDHAPDLSSIGSKSRPEWLMDWIADPRRHDPQSRMPRLRIEEEKDGPRKLADIVAYLMTLKDPGFESRPVPELTPELLDILKEIAFDYHRRVATRAEARSKVEGMSPEEMLAFTGERLVLRYGCFGCHAGISDEFDKTAPIGTELSFHGSKDVDKLDFAHWGHQKSGEYAIKKSRASWFAAKLEDPRIFDVIPKEVTRADGSRGHDPTGEMIQKTPEELLKMPLFSFRWASDPQEDGKPETREKLRAAREGRIQSLVTFLLSRLDDKIPLHKTRRLNADDQADEDGRNLIRFLNCQGCHRIGADPQTVPIHELPTFSYDAPDDQRYLNEIEKETWLAENTRVGKMTIPAGTFLYSDLKDENAAAEDPSAADPFSARMIATRHFEARKVPERERRLKVRGLREGRMRRYFGDTAEMRPLAAPILRKEGDRVNAEWLFDFLLHVKPLRVQLELKMPSFHLTPEEATVLVRWFKTTAGAPYPRPTITNAQAPVDWKPLMRYFTLPPQVPFPPLDLKDDQLRALDRWMKTAGRPPFPYEVVPEHVLTPEKKELAALGREIFQITFPGDRRTDRLQCNTCHPAGNTPPSIQDKTTWGPDLGLARERLRPSWIARWILDPKSHQPGTKMPDNFVSFDDPLTGMSIQREKYPEEVEALVLYLMHMRELDSATTARR